MTRLFISHASQDRKLAEQIIGLLHAALNLPADGILCTSVRGYGLSGGVMTDDELRSRVCDAEEFVALVSKHSLDSVYVSFELGARWGVSKSLRPLLVPGLPTTGLPRPLAGFNVLSAGNAVDLHKFVDDLGHALSLRVASHAVVQSHCEIIAGTRPDNPDPVGGSTGLHMPMEIGAVPEDGRTRFRVWAPDHSRVEVVISTGRAAALSPYQLTRGPDGYFTGSVRDVVPGDRYGYRLDNGDKVYPDPASRYQPGDVHSESEVVDPGTFSWTDHAWRGISLDDLVIYEVHVGTATSEGTFDALITRLGAIREVGVTAIMLMAVADFPGDHSWGYEGVDLFAPARAYGGPEALRRFVDAAHARHLAVILDVVFNHLGPEGNYLAKFSRSYFSEKYTTPWGPALNYHSRQNGRPVCEFVVANACHWAVEYHVDGIRLDAIGAMHDDEEPHIVSKITSGLSALHASGRDFLVIAEDDTNDPKLVRPADEGFGLDAVYADDFHHQLHRALTGERSGYYADYEGTATALADTIGLGWSLVEHTSQWRKDAEGKWKKIGYAGAQEIPAKRFVWSIQDHDQVGNRHPPQRLNQLVSAGAFRAASALLLLSPYTPLLFMGQEWASHTPFSFFVDRENSEGRDIATDHRAHIRKLFPGIDGLRVPDPRDKKTFLDSKLRWDERDRMPHRQMLQFYKTLLRLRHEHPALRNRARGSYSVVAIAADAVATLREGTTAGVALLLIVNLKSHLKVDLSELRLRALRAPAGHVWRITLDSERDFGGDWKATLNDGVVVEMPGAGALLLEATRIAS
jgi:maltooligosyltrehalose trehalohydrolase